MSFGKQLSSAVKLTKVACFPDDYSDDSDDDCLNNPDETGSKSSSGAPCTASMDSMVNPIDKLYMMQDSYFQS